MKLSKYITLWALSQAACLSAYADWRTPQQALDVVSQMPGNKSAVDLSLAYTQSEGGNPLFYVVNRGTNNGFVIVNGWSESETQIIGYTDNGSFAENNMPEGLRILFGQYAEQLKQLPDAPAKTNKTLKATRANIDPLVKVQWGQGSPFNNLVGVGYYPAGCGPIAYAQIMSYWKFPKSHGKSTYNWDAMISDPAETAQLVRDLGISFGTKYSSTGSSTTVSTAINKSVTDFGYDGGEYFVHRDNVTYEQWEDLLYGELAAKRPFLMFARQGKEDKYTGQTVDMGGAHLFVIDGYKDGLYHVNWGWTGAADGYYKLSLESDNYFTNYTSSQMAIVNIKPDDGKPESFVPIYADDVEYWQLCPPKMKPYFYMKVHGAFYRTCVEDVQYSTYLRFTDIDSKEVLYFDFPFRYSWYEQDKKLQMTFKAQDLKTGVKYLMEPVYKLEGSDEYVTIGLPEKYRNATVEVVDQTFDETDLEAEYPRMNLFENYFGRVCGYSVRAHIEVEEAAQKYPDQVFSINYDHHDAYVENYKNIGNWGTPTNFFNRTNGRSPSTGMGYKSSQSTKGKVAIKSLTPSADYSRVTVETTTRFNFNNKDNDYRLCYVLLQDSSYVSQNNPHWYHADNLISYKGTKWYEYNPVPLYLDNYARGIYPDYDGLKGSVPADIEGCTDYTYSYTFNVPTTLTSRDKLHVAVLLYDALYDEVINVADMRLPSEAEVLGAPVVVNLDKAGTLLEKLGGDAARDEIMKIKNLTITGPVNVADLQLIRSMAGRSSIGVSGVFAETNGSLIKLDMIGTQIVTDETDNVVLYNNNAAISTVTDDVLPDKLFSGTKLIEIYLPASIDAVGAEAFAECKSLRRLVMGYFVSRLGDDLFSGCQSLSEIYSLSSSSPDVDSFGDFNYTVCKLYVENGYAYSSKWSNFSLYDPNGNYRKGELMSYFVERYSGALETKMKLDNKKLTLVVDTNKMIRARIMSGQEKSGKVTWKSSDESIAIIAVSASTEIAYVYAIKKGVATITATLEGTSITASCVVTVKEAGDDLTASITLSHSSVSLKVDEELTVNATVTTNKNVDKTLVWTSSNTGVATVDATGKITAKNPGKATITATLKGTEFNEQVEVVVEEPLSASLEMSQSNLNAEVGQKQMLSVAVSASKALDRTVVWTSSDETIATVDQSGMVTGVKAGQVTVTAKLKVMDVSASCLVIVTEVAEPLPEVELIERSVNAFFPGTLSNFIGDQTWIIKSLIVSGSLNAADLQKIRIMCGRSVRGFDGNFAATEGKVVRLDMRNASITRGSSDPAVVYFSMFTSKIDNNYLPSYFFYQTFLQRVMLPTSLTEIGDEVFCECADLELLVLGPNVEKIGDSPFGGCKKLKTIYCPATVPPTLGTLYNFDPSKCILYVPRASIDAYKKDSQWCQFDIRAIEDAPDYTPVESISADGKTIVGYYDLRGRQLTVPQRGVNIIRYNDGSTQKLIVK